MVYHCKAKTTDKEPIMIKSLLYNIILQFIPSKGKRPNPKSNYYRYNLIRRFKKYLRSKQFHQEYNIQSCNSKLNFLNECMEKYWNILEIYAPTNVGLVDDKCKRKFQVKAKEEKNSQISEKEDEDEGKSQKSKKEKTMNNSFVKFFFSKPEVLECYRKYILVIFADKTPGELSKQFGFKCCNNRVNHSMNCYKNWKYLEFYSYTRLICNYSFEKFIQLI
ncbi:hypothetical protein SteCoe_21060 [Stentor coeruleus]|uniref:Uncharacterized protein n=1 Tax=Stentor coeruleus TaxID=5963 RepID=A0A1R2BQB8_9CILI|nr:hypothetical protein SteCoe_21060 [Stentor coeruleus]